MINPEKIVLMTELAKIEKEDGKDIETGNEFYKIDYVSKHMLGAFFSYSLCFVLVMIIVVMYSLGDIVNIVDLTKLADIFKKYMVYYFIGIGIYELIVLIVYSSRYEKAIETKRVYLSKLRKLDKNYD